MTLTRDRIAREIADVLEISRWTKRGEAWKITNAVFQAMATLLLRGEELRIDGFGIFRIRETKPARRHHYFFPYLGKGQHSEIVVVPSKRYIHFTPAKPLLRLINGKHDC